jgi:transposase
MVKATARAGVVKFISSFPEIYLYSRFVDFRKSINGLSQIVEAELKMRPFSGALFVFMGRRKDRVKILYWDKTGFSLWYKRWEEARFCWRRDFDSDVVVLGHEQLEWLLSGVDIWRMKRHESLAFENFG